MSTMLQRFNALPATPIALVAVALALFAVYLALPEIGIDSQPAEDVRVVAPASPGLARAIDICKFGAVSRRLIDEGDGYRYTAIFGLEVLQWPDAPLGRNPLALVNGEAVTLSDEVMTCLRAKF